MHNNKFLNVFLSFLSKLTLILPTFFWLLLIYGFDEPCLAGITVLAALIHECGHIAYLFLFPERKAKLRGVLSGFRIKKSGNSSYKSDILLLASGPFANIAAALFSFTISHENEYALLFAFVNSATALSNLLPIYGYDGYGILRSLIFLSGTEEHFLSLLEGVSFTFVAFVTFSALYILSRIGDSYWMVGLFIFSLIQEVSRRLET